MRSHPTSADTADSQHAHKPDRPAPVPRSDPSLRQEAQRRLSGGAKTQLPLDEADRQRLIHELQVHQIELEMQNEVLRESLVQTQLLKAKYHDLYEQAPVGYFTLSGSGDILESNRLGASLLGLPAAELRGRPLRAFFSDDALPALDRLLQQARHSEDDAVAHHLRVRKKQAMPLYVNAQAHAFTDPAGQTTLRLVLMDVSALKMATDDVVQTILEKKVGLR